MKGRIKNILLYVADQWRGDTLGAMGHPSVRTPNIDAFATEGVTFARHYCQALPCGPSRASMLTGLYLGGHRVVSNGTPLPSNLPNMARYFVDEGHRPTLFGYTDTPLDPEQPGRNDLEDWICPRFTAVAPFLFADGFSGWAADLAAKGYELPDDPRHLWNPTDNWYLPTNNSLLAPSRIAAGDSDTAWLTDRLLVYLDAMGEHPWFAHFNCLKPHPPLYAPRPYHSLHDPADVPLPKGISDSKTIAAQHPWLAYELAAQEGRRNEYPSDKPTIADYDEWDARRLRVAYYGNCSEIDAQFGRVIDRLKAHGRYDETLIIFCSDHGEQLGDNGFWGRRGPYDGNFHVPMIIRDPRAEADRARGSRVNAFTEHVDILPTLLEAIGASPPNPCDGRSLIPFLTGSVPENWRDAVHFAYDFRDLQKNTAEAALSLPSSACHFNAIRGERWKYIEFPELPPLLYDLTNDPEETMNLAADASYSAVIEEQSLRLKKYRRTPSGRDLSEWFQPYGGTLQHYQIA